MAKKAITLPELIIVIGIMVVISTLAVFSSSYLPTRRLQGEASKMVSDLCLVREKALTENSDYCVRFSSNTYDIYKGTCGSSSFIRHREIKSSISSPSVPFDLTFYAFDNGSGRQGGTAYSSASGGSGELVINIEQESRSRNVHVFQETGYIKQTE